MNVLIFTGKFGLGHVAAARALRQEIINRDPNAAVTIVDIIEDCCPQLRHLVYGCFDFTVNYCSGVYNLLNRMAGRYGASPMKHIAVQKVDKLIRDGSADLILSTLPLCSQYITAYKRATGSDIPLYTYVTDISAHSEWVTPGTDCYFVGDETTRLQLLRQGVPASRIVVSGIPVGRDFRPRAKAETGKKELLVMGGGLGLLPDADAALDALAKEPDIHVTVITGTNEALRKQLTAAYPGFTVLGYTHRVADYMTQADLLLTKAGGSTTFEAIHSGTPLCLLHPFLMQEQANADYVARNGFGYVLAEKGQQGREILALLRDDETLADMRQRMAVALRSLDTVTALDRYYGEVRAAC